MARIESLLSARLFLAPQLWQDRIYFISDMSGRFSLYVMDYGGSVPEPLLPPDIALQNPELIGGYSFHVSPRLSKILVSIDNNGDENYQPMLIPVDGGFPEHAFPDVPEITNARVFFQPSKYDETIVYLMAASHTEQVVRTYRADLATGQPVKLYESKWGGWVAGANHDNSRIALVEGYMPGDHVLYLWEQGPGQEGKLRLLYGTPLEQRQPEQQIRPNAISNVYFTEGERGLIMTTALFEDTYGVAYMDLSAPDELRPVQVTGTVHTGAGELAALEHLHDERYLVQYNIDGVSWAYEGSFDADRLALTLDRVICGQGELRDGVMGSIHYDDESDRFVLSFSTAASPTQIYSVEGADRSRAIQHTRERILGIPRSHLSSGEDASFISFDGLGISARLYMPSEESGFEGPRPVVYYIHGGPQSQERPNFAWFSMPLIQFLTLNGFAVFVPNVRGSSGYGLSYMKQVDRDWGGKDRLDHVQAVKMLAQDPRLDTSHMGLVGRSYGGYMTLTLAARHPELWSAAVDMFGPYNLLTFMERIPETWKPYFAIAVGDPHRDRDFLLERSPYTYMQNIRCPLLVIQGANDPRVVERESRDVVESLRAMGKQVEYIVFEDEGHDVIKFHNKVRCYNAITEFFKKHLQAG
jgi:pimeloyl-ACP methyl ester carboxylesterase